MIKQKGKKRRKEGRKILIEKEGIGFERIVDKNCILHPLNSLLLNIETTNMKASVKLKCFKRLKYRA